MNVTDPRVSFFLNQDIALDPASEAKLDQLLRKLKDVERVVVLPDVHSKPDNPVPTGLVIASKNKIYPFAIGQEIGCGVRVLNTSLTEEEVTSDTIDNIFKSIKTLLRDNIKKEALVSKQEYIDILMQGQVYAKEKFFFEEGINFNNLQLRLPEEYLEKVSQRQFIKAIPKDAFLGGLYRLGALGGGNHFLELQVVDKLFDKEKAYEFDLQEGKLIFMFHSGAGVFAKRLDNYYARRIESHRWDKVIRQDFRKLLYHLNDFKLNRFFLRKGIFFKESFKGIPDDTPEARRYMTALRAAFNYSYVNRSFISQFIHDALQESLGIDVKLELVADSPHERIDFDNIGGQNLWVHRNGASRIDYLQERGLFPVPSFPGGPSFLCQAQEGLKGTLCSINHGAGRVFTKKQAKNMFSKDEVLKTFSDKGIKLYKMGDENICEQSPFAFKDIAKLINLLRQSRLLKPVVSTKPLAVVKG